MTATRCEACARPNCRVTYWQRVAADVAAGVTWEVAGVPATPFDPEEVERNLSAARASCFIRAGRRAPSLR